MPVISLWITLGSLRKDSHLPIKDIGKCTQNINPTGYQVKIAEVFEAFSAVEARPLADFVKMVEDVEKAQPSTFSTIEVLLHEREMGELDQFFLPMEDLDSPDFKVNIIPSVILRERIKALDFFTQKNRKMRAA